MPDFSVLGKTRARRAFAQQPHFLPTSAWRRILGNLSHDPIGVYPTTGLREARDARDEAKRLLADGRDPSLAKKQEKAALASAAANTFDHIADELLDKKRREEKPERTLSKLEWLLSLARPAIGSRPIAEIRAPEVLAVFRRVDAQRKRPMALGRDRAPARARR